MADQTRYRIIRDGVGACIEMLPVTERQVVHSLGIVWLWADSRASEVKPSEGEWPSLY